MNKLRLFLSLALMGLMFVACEKEKTTIETPNTPESALFKGTMDVDQNDGTSYTQSDVEVNYEIKDGKLNFTMLKVKFSPNMPLQIDMVVEGADYEETADGYTISGENIVPLAMGGPFPQFTITNLEGSIKGNEMTLSFMCGEYPVVYNGTR